jgi:hypothetical protein
MQHGFASPSDLVRRPAPMRRWFNWPDLQDRVLGVTLSVTMIGVTMLSVGALVWLGIRFWS